MKCVLAPAFDKWFSCPADARAALKWLLRAKLLQLKDGAKPSFPNTEWAVTFPKIGGKGARCYQFLDPRKAR